MPLSSSSWSRDIPAKSGTRSRSSTFSAMTSPSSTRSNDSPRPSRSRSSIGPLSGVTAGPRSRTRLPLVLGGAREAPALDADGRDDHPAEEALERLADAGHCDGPGQRVEVALRVAQVPHRSDDPAALHQERAVAGHAGDDGQLGV